MMTDECISIKDHGLQYGYGLFETLRIYNGVPFLLDEHIQRLLISSKALSFDCMPGAEILTQKVLEFITDKDLQSQALRLSVTFGNPAESIEPQVFLTHRAVPYGRSDYETGISAALSPFPKNQHSPLAQHKTFNQLEHILAQQFSRSQGVQECLFLNTSGYLTEGSKSNLFFARDGVIFTPSTDCGILPGITRQKIIDLLRQTGLCVREERCLLVDLYAADECFCTNSLMEVVPLTTINDQAVGTGSPGSLTRLAGSGYRQCVRDHIRGMTEGV